MSQPPNLVGVPRPAAGCGRDVAESGNATIAGAGRRLLVEDCQLAEVIAPQGGELVPERMRQGAVARGFGALATDSAPPSDLFRLFTREQKERLFRNIAAAMEGVPEEIVQHQLGQFQLADPQYAEGVARALKRPVAAGDAGAPRAALQSWGVVKSGRIGANGE
ncbi:MAG TPA: catalase-related domain-containing protein [Chthoniobacter sp.]|jgi:catalase